MENIIKLSAQLLFLIGTIIFLIYSALAIYCLSSYAPHKGVGASISFIYIALSVLVISWGAIIVIQL